MTTTRTPQDQAINYSLPIQCYEIHEWEGKLYGSVIDWKPSWQAQRDYNISFDLRGKAAHYLLLTNDASILRSEAISFALALHQKKYILHRCDTDIVNNWQKVKK